MKCDEARHELHQAARPEQGISAALDKHLRSCAGCQAVREELIQLREGLRQLPAPPVPEGFELALRRRLKSEADDLQRAGANQAGGQVKGTARTSWTRRLLPIAAAASVLLLLGALTSFSILRLRAQDSGSTGQAFALHLSVEAAEEQRDALFDVQLPPGIRLTPVAARAVPGSGPTVRWRSHLRPGRNEIDLPLLVEGPGALRVALRAGGRSLATTVQVGAASASRPGVVLVAWRLEAGSPKEVRQ
jgi:hypothetical protein